MNDTLESRHTVKNDQSFDEVCSAMREDMLSGEGYPLQPISVSSQDTNTANIGFDFSMIDNPETDPNVGLFTIKDANQTIDDASNRPMPCKLFGQLWFEHEVCILFSSTNLGKSILAVQIADAISSGRRAMGLEMESDPQTVLYFDFELSDKQFELRYVSESGSHYHFSPKLKRAEINPDGVECPDGCNFEDFVKLSLQQAVEHFNAKVIIIDNITFLCREAEKAKDALPLMQWLKSFGKKYDLSILVLAHTPKRNNSNPITMNDLFGSSMQMNFCDGMFAIGKSAKGNQVRYIKELKQRNLPFAYDSEYVRECEIVKPDDFLHFRFIGYGCESEHLRQITYTDREALIEKVKELSGRGKTQREISYELGISVGTVNNYLNKNNHE